MEKRYIEENLIVRKDFISGVETGEIKKNFSELVLYSEKELIPLFHAVSWMFIEMLWKDHGAQTNITDSLRCLYDPDHFYFIYRNRFVQVFAGYENAFVEESSEVLYLRNALLFTSEYEGPVVGMIEEFNTFIAQCTFDEILQQAKRYLKSVRKEDLTPRACGLYEIMIESHM